MPFSGMLLRVSLVSTEVSEKLSASFIRVTRIGELGKTLAITSNRRTLRRNLRKRHSSKSKLVSHYAMFRLGEGNFYANFFIYKRKN
jgi:hypothetical protein